MSGVLAAAETALRLGLVAVFLLAAAGKAAALREATAMVQALLPRLPAGAARAAVVGTVGYEVALATALAGADRAGAGEAAVATGLAAAVFAGASVLALRGETGIGCRCFGSLGAAAMLGARTLARAGLLAAAALLWYAATRAGGVGVTPAAARVPLCFAVAAVLATALMWRRLLPGVAHRRFAAAALQAQMQRPVVVEYGGDGVEERDGDGGSDAGSGLHSEREGVR